MPLLATVVATTMVSGPPQKGASMPAVAARRVHDGAGGSVDAVATNAFDVVIANISEIVIGDLKSEFDRVAPRRILSGFQDAAGEWTCIVE